MPMPATLRRAPSQVRAQDTVHRILNGAASVVIAEQTAQPRIAEVARRSNVARGAIYRYFPSSDAIVAALFANYVAKRMAEFRAMLATLPQDADTRDICATVVMATLRACSGQAIGPVQRHLRRAFYSFAQRNGYPGVRGMTDEFAAFLESRNLRPQGQPGDDLIFAAGVRMRDDLQRLEETNPAALTEAATAHDMAAWLHQTLFPAAPALQ